MEVKIIMKRWNGDESVFDQTKVIKNCDKPVSQWLYTNNDSLMICIVGSNDKDHGECWDFYQKIENKQSGCVSSTQYHNVHRSQASKINRAIKEEKAYKTPWEKRNILRVVGDYMILLNKEHIK